MFIRSERLFLRPGWPEDWNELFSRTADQAIVRNLAAAPWVEAGNEAGGLAGGGQAQPRQPRLPHFLITLPRSAAGALGSELIGSIGLLRASPSAEQDCTGQRSWPELGFWIGREHRNRGYASEATRAVLHLARTLGHCALVAHHFPEHPAAAQVLRKVGFAPTGSSAPRWSLVSGRMESAAIHVIALRKPSDCDDGGSDAMRAA